MPSFKLLEVVKSLSYSYTVDISFSLEFMDLFHRFVSTPQSCTLSQKKLQEKKLELVCGMFEILQLLGKAFLNQISKNHLGFRQNLASAQIGHNPKIIILEKKQTTWFRKSNSGFTLLTAALIANFWQNFLVRNLDQFWYDWYHWCRWLERFC